MKAAIATLVTISLCSPSFASDGVRLTLTERPPGGLIRVRPIVQVDIATTDSNYWVLYPRFESRTDWGPRMPRARLVFRITGPDGQVVKLVPEAANSDGKFSGHPARPGFQEFFVMGPTNTFGTTISLAHGPWAHSFPKPGKYRVRVELITDARQWLMGAFKSGLLDESQVPFAIERVVEGRFVSDEIEVEVSVNGLDEG